MKLSLKSTKLADLHLPVKINGDIALMKGIGKYLLDEKRKGNYIFDEDFISEKTTNFEDYIKSLDETDWDLITASSGIKKI